MTIEKRSENKGVCMWERVESYLSTVCTNLEYAGHEKLVYLWHRLLCDPWYEIRKLWK